MRKFAMFLITIVVLASLTACANGGTSSNQGNNGSNGGTSSSQGNNDLNGGASPGQGNNNPSGDVSPSQGNNGQNGGVSPGQGNRQPGDNQQMDSSYSIEDLIERVKQAGCISGEPESLDVKAIGAVKGVAYGNVVFLDYEYTYSQEFMDAYAANKVTINGKEAKIGAINGPYVMAFFDNNVNQNAVKAFHSLGFGD